HTEEVGPVFEVLFRSTRQSQIDFVDYSRGLQSMARILLGHVALRHLVQLAVHERHEPVERGPVTLAPLDEQLRDFLGRGCHGFPLATIGSTAFISYRTVAQASGPVLRVSSTQ